MVVLQILTFKMAGELRHNQVTFMIPVTVIVQGHTDAQKSSFCNKFLNLTEQDDDHFPVGHGVDSETADVTHKTRTIDGRQMRIYDVPGYGDTEGRDADFYQKMVDELPKARFVHAVAVLVDFSTIKMRHDRQVFFGKFAETFTNIDLRGHLCFVFTKIGASKRRQLGLDLKKNMKTFRKRAAEEISQIVPDQVDDDEHTNFCIDL
jgi:GTP-binding protein EngB required for normal cell division